MPRRRPELLHLGPTLAGRLRRIGLQRRIMLYVTVGLALMFGVVAYLGLGAIDQATHLVYEERLTTAYTTAGILERDLERIAADARETARDRLPGSTSGSTGIAVDILDDLQLSDAASPFFSVVGVWVLDEQGTMLDHAGSPEEPTEQSQGARSAIATTMAGRFRVYQAAGPAPGSVPFAAVAVRLGDTPTTPLAVIHTVSINSTSDYAPAVYGRSSPSAGGSPTTAADERYQLEVVDPDGTAVLGIGPDEEPGHTSHHFAAIQELMASGGAATLQHNPHGAGTLQPHVMAVVPLAASPLYVVLEQPADIALALPLQLRNQLVIWTVIGFMASLAFAWITTRRVVKPTEQLTAAAARMATGDLASPIAVSAQDEVGRLAESLDAMRKRLKDAQETVEATNRELESRVAARTAQLGQVLRQTISAQEEERRRLARELHDETAQTLAALSIALDQARDALAGGTEASTRYLSEAKAIAVRLLEETRRLILGLRPSALDDLGLVPALRWYCESTLTEHGVIATVEGALPGGRLPPHTEVAVFRIVQEALNNIARHAEAQQASVHLDLQDNALRITVTDDGRGFDVEDALARSDDGGSVGLIGMLERVKLLDGRMEIRSSVGAGTTVIVEVPIREGDAA